MAKPKKSVTPIIEPELAKRFETACENSDDVPPFNQGRLAWIANQFLELHGQKVSRESVRKWLAGEARPRPDKMKVLASILKVSESWLSLGTRSEPSPEQMRRRSISAESAVNLVAGMFGMNGASYAYPERDDQRADHVHFYAILRGRQNAVFVSAAQETKEGLRFSVSNKFESLLLIGVVMRSPTQFDLYQIPASLLSKYGLKRGSHVELNVKDSGKALTVRGEELQRIKDFESLRRTNADEFETA